MSEIYLRDEANGTGNGAETVSSTNPFPVVLIAPGGGVGGGSQFRQLDSSAGTLSGLFVPTSYLVGSSGTALLPNAAALADNLANPTTTQVGANLLLWRGAGQWSRAVTADSSSIGDAGAGTNTLSVSPINYNGSTLDRQYNNTAVTLLASAAHTTTQTSADLTNFNGSALHVILDVTTPGTGSITLTINGKDPASGKYYLLLSGAAVTTTSTNIYRVGPGITPAGNANANDFAPRVFQIVVTANNANSMTYSVGYNLRGN